MTSSLSPLASWLILSIKQSKWIKQQWHFFFKKTITSDHRYHFDVFMWVWGWARWQQIEWQCARCKEKQSPGMTSQWTGSFITVKSLASSTNCLPNKGLLLRANQFFFKIILALFADRKIDILSSIGLKKKQPLSHILWFRTTPSSWG